MILLGIIICLAAALVIGLLLIAPAVVWFGDD